MTDAIAEIIDGKPVAKEDWERVYLSMIVHTRGVKPAELLKDKRPNEPDDIYKYRLANHRPVTKTAINNAIDSVYRILIGSNYVINYSKNLADYLDKKNFDFLGEQLTFKQLFFKHILRLVFDDPNGLLVWMPQNPLDSSVSPVFSPPNEKIEVVPVYVKSKQIKVLEKDKVAWEAEDKWKVTVNEGQKKSDKYEPYYFVITPEAITRLIPFWNKDKRKVDYREELYFNIAIDEEGLLDPLREFPSLPVKMLGGNIALNEKGDKYYDSFFGGFCAFGDECICAFSDNQAVRVRYNFPFVSIKGEKCTTCKGVGQVADKKGKIQCDTCKGSGMVIPFTPHGHFRKEPPATSDNEAYMASPAVEFYSPDVAILQNSYTTWKDLLEEAKDAVNLLFTKEAQSGVAKEVDREQKYEMLLKISNNLFELVKWSLEIIEAYRVPFKDDRKESDVRPPVTFAIKTQSQLSEELTDLIAKESPSPFINTTAKRLSEKLYNDDSEAQKVIDVLTRWDALFGKTAQQISSLKSSGGATTKDVIKNVNAYTILTQIALENDLTKMEIPEIIELAEAKLEELIPDEQPRLFPPTEQETEIEEQQEETANE